jgi:hypothetical protein
MSNRIGVLAASLGSPVCALFVPDGYTAVTEVVLTPESTERVRLGGRPVADELAARIAGQLSALILQACAPDRAKPSSRTPRRRRSREEITRGIEAAKQARGRRLAAERAWAAGGEGPSSEF